MNTFKKTMLVVAVACLLSLVTVDGQHGVMTYGPTNESCGTSSAELGQARKELRWWVFGFVSGAARELALRDIALRQTDPEGIEAWITKYCGDHPLDGLARATFMLVDELKRTK